MGQRSARKIKEERHPNILFLNNACRQFFSLVVTESIKEENLRNHQQQIIDAKIFQPVESDLKEEQHNFTFSGEEENVGASTILDKTNVPLARGHSIYRSIQSLKDVFLYLPIYQQGSTEYTVKIE